MSDTKKLVSFRCAERDWQDFKVWADNQSMTATEALTRYIKQALGRETIITSSVMTSDIEDRLARLEGELENIPDVAPIVESLRTELLLIMQTKILEPVLAIESLRSKMESLRSELMGEIDSLKKVISERRLNLLPPGLNHDELGEMLGGLPRSTVATWAQAKNGRETPKDYKGQAVPPHRYDPEKKRWFPLSRPEA